MFKFSSPTTKELKESLEMAYGRASVEEIFLGDVEVVLATVDTASGIARKGVIIYTRKSSGAPWMILLYRATNSSSITFKVENGGLAVYSKSGKKLFFVPTESVNLGFDPLEQ